MKAVEYIVVWRWRTDTRVTNSIDYVNATDAQRAIRKLRLALSREYADVAKLFVPLSVVRCD